MSLISKSEASGQKKINETRIINGIIFKKGGFFEKVD
jgi:hypothetical protein